jgi:hypothetical protein
MGLIARAAFAALALAPPQTGFAATTVPLAQRLPARDRLFLLPDRFDNGDPANDTGGLMGDG